MSTAQDRAGSERCDQAAALERARAGDASAYTTLICAHRGEALRLARSVTRSTADAEDAVQEATLKAWRAMPGFRAGASFRPWLMAIVANEARDRVRENSRRGQLAARAAEAERVSAGGVGDEQSPDRLLIVAEEAAHVREAVSFLPDRDREAIELRYREGLSEDEMAARLNCAPGTVKSRLARARARLRDHLNLVLIGVVLAAGLTAVAVPPVRAALERLLGVSGAIEFVAVPELPPDTIEAPFDWGPAVTAAQAGERAGFRFPRPSIDGERPEIRFTPELAGGAVTLAYRHAAVTIFRDRAPLSLAKLVPPGTRIRDTTVRGRPAIWLRGNAHALARVDSRGRAERGPPTRIEASVLAWPGQGGLAYRLQTELPFKDALAFARRFR